jgi:hypothetical protein
VPLVSSNYSRDATNTTVESCLKLAIIQLYHGRNKLHFDDDVYFVHSKLDFDSISSLKQIPKAQSEYRNRRTDNAMVKKGKKD